jgi:hypothetical protein
VNCDIESSQKHRYHPYSARVLHSSPMASCHRGCVVWPMDHHPHNPLPFHLSDIVTPQCRLPPLEDDDPESHIPDLIFEVVKLSMILRARGLTGLTFRTVLIVKIKRSQHWQQPDEPGRIQDALQRQLNRQTDATFAGTAHNCTGLACHNRTSLEVRKKGGQQWARFASTF